MNEISPKLNMLDARLAGENAEMLFHKLSNFGGKTDHRLTTLKHIAGECERHNLELALGRTNDMEQNRQFRESAFDVGFGSALDTRVTPITAPVVGRGAVETAESIVIYSAIREKLDAKLDGLTPAQRIDTLANLFGGNHTYGALLNREIADTQFNPNPCARVGLISPTLINAMAEHNFRTARNAETARLAPAHLVSAIEMFLNEK